MSVKDDPQGRARLEQAQQVLLEKERRLSDVFEISIYQFDAETRPLKRLGAVGMLAPNGSETNIAGALRTAVGGEKKSRLIAAVLFSDGIDNSGQDVVGTAKQLGVPIHVVATGYDLTGTDAGRDVSIAGVECADPLPRNTQARIMALVEARGLKGRVVQVELVEKDAVLATASLTLDDVEGVQRVELLFTPETKGRHEYTVRIPKLSDELIGQNNQHSVSTLVVDARLRVLYVEGGIRAEYGTLVGRYLARDPTLEYLAMVQTKPGLFIQRTNIPDWTERGIPSSEELLKTFDVFIIGDLDSRFLTTARMVLLEKLVRDEGKGLLMIGGEHSFGGGGYAGSPLAKVLPVEITNKADQITEPFRVKLTAAGRNHPIFTGITEYFEDHPVAADGPSLPDLLGCSLLERPKPSAEVLLVHPERGNEHGPLTVLAVHPYGKGRAAAFAGDTTYRWYQVMQSLKESSPYIRFWGQLVRWLAGQEEEEALEPGLRVNTDKGFYEPGETVRLEAVLIGEDGRGVNNAKLQAVFTSEATGDRKIRVPLVREADRAGAYVARFIPRHSALYHVEVTARLPDGTVPPKGQQTIQIQVGRPSAEFDRLDLDEATLQGIAAATGGQYVHVARAGRLLESLVNEQRARRVLLEQPLYNPPLFWALCVGLVTTEWLLRRKYRLR
ncbi:MAG TPA: hypothetical protein EYP14_16110, partial [Planctomycetaceae bacterium]|nr:hypothetical protein [Planctomycetaceae bacterium]